MNQFHLSVPDPGVNGGGTFEIGSFDFHGKPVIILSNDSGNWAVLGQLCANLTLDANGQRQAIERKSWSNGKTCVTHVMLPGQPRAYPQFLIHERIVPMWLANITSSRIEDPASRLQVDACGPDHLWRALPLARHERQQVAHLLSRVADVLVGKLVARSVPPEPKSLRHDVSLVSRAPSLAASA